jgi:hypothetical protein
VTARRALLALGRAIAIPLGLAASLGIVDVLRGVPGPSLALALPLRETGHDDRASVLVVVLACALVFGLLALALEPARRPAPGIAVLEAIGVLVCALALQAVSLQLIRQATLGVDWRAAILSPAPYACALGALAGSGAAALVASSDRWRRPGPKEHPVEGRSAVSPLAKIGS